MDPEAPRDAIANVAVGDGEHDLSLMRFVPGDLEIRVGESVAFTNRDTGQMPHTVTFRAGRPSPEMITPQRSLMARRSWCSTRTSSSRVVLPTPSQATSI